jgi:hypothetical protein
LIDELNGTRQRSERDVSHWKNSYNAISTTVMQLREKYDLAFANQAQALAILANWSKIDAIKLPPH